MSRTRDGLNGAERKRRKEEVSRLSRLVTRVENSAYSTTAKINGPCGLAAKAAKNKGGFLQTN
jgi:hypothetical protein